MPLDHVDVDADADPDAGTVTIRAEVQATARTGVEMEALTAASVAALTLYDMAKALQRDIVIERVELLEQGGRPERHMVDGRRLGPRPGRRPRGGGHHLLEPRRGRRARGRLRPGRGEALREAGFDVAPEPILLPDDEDRIAATLAPPGGRGRRLIITSGGTGLTPGGSHAGRHAAGRSTARSRASPS